MGSERVKTVTGIETDIPPSGRPWQRFPRTRKACASLRHPAFSSTPMPSPCATVLLVGIGKRRLAK